MGINCVVLRLVFWIVVSFLGFQGVAWASSDVGDEQVLLVAFKAPDFDGQKNWINSPGFKSMEELRGKVVLINLWTSSCVSCVQAFSYVQGWHETYKEKGLTVIGIHPPEYGAARNMEDLVWTAKKRGLTFPIVQDNGFKLWRKYGNRIWPAVFLIDKTGNIRYSHLGKGNYEKTETEIVKLLSE
jgi:peroxiredoxin